MIRRFVPLMSFGVAVALGACGSGGNLHADNTYHGSAAEPVKHPQYDPYMGPGDAPVTWVAPTFNRDGMIATPRDPQQQWQWEDYEKSPWFNAGGGAKRPPGTF